MFTTIPIFYYFLFNSSRTSSTCPFTLTFRHSLTSTPFSSIRNVLRSIPMTFLPYIFFSLMTSNCLHNFSSGSDNKSKEKDCLLLKFSLDLILSRETPRMTLFLALNFLLLFRKSLLSDVLPCLFFFGLELKPFF